MGHGMEPPCTRGRSLQQLYRKKLRHFDCICKEAAGEWADAIHWNELYADIEERLVAADRRRNPVVNADRYVSKVCKHRTHVHVVRLTGLFARALAGDRAAAEAILLMLLPFVQEWIAKHEVENFVGSFFSKATTVFVDTLTQTTRQLRNPVPDIIHKLLSRILFNCCGPVLRRAGLQSGAQERRLFGEPSNLDDLFTVEFVEEIDERPVISPLESLQSINLRSFSWYGFYGLLTNIEASTHNRLTIALVGGLRALPKNHCFAFLAKYLHEELTWHQMVERFPSLENADKARVWASRARSALKKHLMRTLGLVTPNLDDDQGGSSSAPPLTVCAILAGHPTTSAGERSRA